MYKITNTKLVEEIEHGSDPFRIRITDLSTDLVYTGECCMSAESDMQTTAESDDIQFGAVCSAQWDLTLYNPTKHKFLGHKLKLELYITQIPEYSVTTWGDLEGYTCAELDRQTIYQLEHLTEALGTLWIDVEGCTCEELDQMTISQLEASNEIQGEPIPMGYFYAVRSRQNADFTELTLFDRLYWADTVYTPSEGFTFPCSSSALEQDILHQLDIESGIDYYTSALLRDGFHRLVRTVSGQLIRVSGYEFTVHRADIPEGCTKRELLGYIASSMGQFGYIDRFGKYVRKWYTVPATEYRLSNSTISTPTLSERPNRIAGLICTTGETVRTAGDTSGKEGRVIEFENPFMTETLFNSLWRQLQVQDLHWYTAELTQILGDPRLDPGDIVIYSDGEEDYYIPITSLSFGFDGGLWANIRSVGKDYEEEVIL